MWFNLAKDVWRVLRIRFSQGDYFRIADLQEQIYGLKQDSQITTDYATQLDLFVMNLWKWGQLFLAAVIQSVAVMQIRNFIYQQMNQVICFRKGLNDNFWTIHSQIVHMDPVPDVDRVFALVLQHQSQLHVTRNRASVENGLLPNNLVAAQMKKSFNKRPLSTFCGMQGHTIDKCYQKHGYPPGYKFTNKQVHSVQANIETPSAGFPMASTQLLIQLLKIKLLLPLIFA